jgi:hypothetical protein
VATADEVEGVNHAPFAVSQNGAPYSSPTGLQVPPPIIFLQEHREPGCVCEFRRASYYAKISEKCIVVVGRFDRTAQSLPAKNFRRELPRSHHQCLLQEIERAVETTCAQSAWSY